jgi:ribosomal protein L7Ae-like RNA K-turn-binding protein
MMNPAHLHKAKSYLGLAMRAGKLVTGDEGVLQAIRSGQAVMVWIAEDASANALKKYRDKCHFFHVPLIERLTREELGTCVGKPQRVVVAVTDKGFAEMIQKVLS